MFTHLHVHSWFSLGSGVSSPAALIEAAARRGFTALACTDTNGVYGAVEFQRQAEEQGIRPILGAHLLFGGEECIALAADDRGWASLCRAITAMHWADVGLRGKDVAHSLREQGSGAFEPDPVIRAGPDQRSRRERASALAPRISAASADVCPRGERWSAPAPTPSPSPASADPCSTRGHTRRSPHERPLLSARLAADREGLILLSPDPAFLERLLRLSGPRDLYAELRPGKERHAVGAAAKRLGIPTVVTGGVMFANPENWPLHRLRVAIARNTTMDGIAEGAAPRDAWLRPAADLARHFPDCPDALDRAAEIADRCRYRIPVGQRTVAPRFTDTDDAMARLHALAFEGASRRYGTIAPVTRDRLEHELAIIGQKGFADYFLVVHDIVRHGPTHCGRGSVANSIVSYALGITHVDPLGAGLLFERFLNPERKDPPDIDLDFPWDERDQILAWVFRRYPMPRAAMVSNHNCFRLRGALREVAKVHGRPAGEIREVTRRFPWFMEEETLEDVLTTHPNFRGLELPAAWRDLARQAQPLVGVPRHLSLHPGGVVIVPGALTDYVPVEPAARELDRHPDLTVPVIQFEKDGAEDAGLVKIDLLGNRSLAVIRDAIESVRASTGRQIDYTADDPDDDEPTKALFRTGQTMGVFYTESPASRLLCAKSRADTFELLVLNTSIIRPASNRFIKLYLERLHGGSYEPLDPSLRDALAETFGVMVYQEDVVNVCAAFAGMPLAAGDGVRKALSKKRPVKQLAAYAGEFFAGAAALGRDPEVAVKVWEMILSFAGYSFCKGHSCSYIKVAQHACYLRAHYPAAFIAAVLANGGGFYRPFVYVAEALRMGLTVKPPDVNASAERTSGTGREVRVGLQYISGLSRQGVERLTAARAEGEFGSLADLRARTGLAHDDLRLLAKVGALDSLAAGMTRPMLLWAVDAVPGAGHERDGGLLPADRPVGGQAVQPPALREYTPERRRQVEYELLGFTTDGHPMDLYREVMARFRIVRSTELARHVGQTVLCAGLLTTAKPVHTVNDEPMEFATFDDGTGLIEGVLFPGIYKSRGHVLFDQGPFLLRGKVQEEFGAVTLTVTGLDRLERVAAAGGSAGDRPGTTRRAPG